MKSFKGRIVIYSLATCPHCKAAKAKLTELELPYTDVSVEKYDAKVRKWVKERTGKTSVPQIFFNDRYIGGNSDLKTLVENPEEFGKALKEVEDNGPPSNEVVFIPGDEDLAK